MLNCHDSTWRLGLFVLVAGAIDCSMARADTVAITAGFVVFEFAGLTGQCRTARPPTWAPMT